MADGGFSAQQVFEDGRCVGMNAWCTAEGCWHMTYPDGSAASIRDARRRWEKHWRDGECVGGSLSWSRHPDAAILAAAQRQGLFCPSCGRPAVEVGGCAGCGGYFAGEEED